MHIIFFNPRILFTLLEASKQENKQTNSIKTQQVNAEL